MHGSLNLDLAVLDRRAFHRREKSGYILEEWYSKQVLLRKHKDFNIASKVYRWLFVPLSLWPIDVHGLMEHLIQTLLRSKRIGKQMVLLVGLLGEPPSSDIQEAAALEEFAVQSGNYERLLRSQHKYEANEAKLAKNKRFREEWASIKREWDVSKFANRTGVVRRRMIQERGFRSDWNFRWSDEKTRFQCVFDSFCQRWDLYGMLGDSPLLLKFSVNLMPHGTMIVVPRYWSLDARRDLQWKEITKLHRIHGAHRQGIKLIQNRIERQKEAEAAQALFESATKMGLRGAERKHWIMDALGWHPGTDISRLQRLLKEVKS